MNFSEISIMDTGLAYGRSPTPSRQLIQALDSIAAGLPDIAAGSSNLDRLIHKAVSCRAVAATSSGTALHQIGHELADLWAALQRLLRHSGDSRVGLSECEANNGSDNSHDRLSQIEMTLRKLEEKMDLLLQNLTGKTDPNAAGALRVGETLKQMKGLIVGTSAEAERLRIDNQHKGEVIKEMAEGTDHFVSGISARLGTSKERDIFFLLIAKHDDGQNGQRILSYQDIGDRLGGISKQAVNARVRRFERKHPEAWEYVRTAREHMQVTNFSELSPSQRRKHGVDESYNHTVN